MKKFVAKIMMVSCLVIIGVACSSAMDMKTASIENESADSVERFMIPQSDVAASKEIVSQSVRAVTSVPQQMRKLIKNASLKIEVDDAVTTSKSISTMAVENGGYIADNAQQKIGDERYQISMTVRMPSDQFDQVAEEFQRLGTVLSFSSSAQDVTEEYVDTESRTRNLKKSEERLLDH